MAGQGPIRRSQLIAPFGVGSIAVMRGGLNLIAAGLDHWYERDSAAGRSTDVDTSEFQFREPRLQNLLGVDHFRLPPDHRGKEGMGGGDVLNLELTVPFLRFPQWHVCPACKRMHKLRLHDRAPRECPSCKALKGWGIELQQVRFIAMCAQGHIQDFPWNEWVHKTATPGCDGSGLRLERGSGSSLSSVRVHCDQCKGEPRSLSRITSASRSGTSTVLTEELDPTRRYLCPGRSVWLGTEEALGCEAPLRGALPGAANVYYACVESAVSVPVDWGEVRNFVNNVLANDRFLQMVFDLARRNSGGRATVQAVREEAGGALHQYDDAFLQSVIDDLDSAAPEVTDPRDRVGFRHQEYVVLRETRTTAEVDCRLQDIEAYAGPLRDRVGRVCLVQRLQETRALVGFTRVIPPSDPDVQGLKARLRRVRPAKEWLPACRVYGEGVYLELEPSVLEEWERRDEVLERVRPVVERNDRLRTEHRARPEDITPRFVLLHTLAHLLMNQLVFDCGYGSASLRERLYASLSPGREMAGVLLYTAAGDSEGTLGGLVRMGSAGRLERVLERALAAASWCSGDPVCMELGYEIGQGPDGCNLAACHNCALVPETACEEFNKYLDRGLVVGTPQDPGLGFFSQGGS